MGMSLTKSLVRQIGECPLQSTGKTVNREMSATHCCMAINEEPPQDITGKEKNR
jgi:hypothetical protein